MKNLINEELAVKSVHDFLCRFQKSPTNIDKVKEEYPDTVEYVKKGLLVFDESQKPTLTLQSPLKNDKGDITIKDVEFKTRIKPTAKADLADGLDLQKQSAKFSLRLIAYIISQPIALLDRFEMEDYDVVTEVAAVFMAGGR
jgi:hypothetical protein